MAAGLGLSFESGRPAAPLEPDEASLRAARYGWLQGIYGEAGAGALALGHHGDDLLESMLMGLLSGAGPAGMASPMPVKHFADGHVRVRPLLAMKREQIERSLRELEIPWREDPSNRDPAYTRNWLRHELLPLLRRHFPQDIFSGAQRTRFLMQETVEALDAVATTIEADLSNPHVVDCGKLRGNPPALVRRLLMAWWLRHRPDSRLPKEVVDQIVPDLCAGVDRMLSIGHLAGQKGGWVLELAQGRLRLRQEREASPVAWSAGVHWAPRSGPLFLRDGALLHGTKVALAGGEHPYRQADPDCEAWLARVKGPLLVRQWQAGDRYQPLGAPGSRKLQDLFTDAKILAEQRHRLPVLLNSAGNILWVPGFPPAEAFRICHEDNSALKLTYQRH